MKLTRNKTMTILLILILVVAGIIVGLYACKNQDPTVMHLRTKSYLDPKTYTLNPINLPIQKPMDYNTALEYISAWKKYDNTDESSLTYKIIETPGHIRINTGSFEFEYNDSDHVLIVRGLINRNLQESNPLFHKALLVNLQNMQNNKDGIAASFGDAYIEDDMTGAEITPQYPERLNLRLDIKDTSLSPEAVVDMLDNFDSLVYAFRIGDYEKIHTQTSVEVFGK